VDAQFLITLVLIGAASVFLLHRSWRTWHALNRGGCPGGTCCGKERPTDTKAAPVFVPSERLTLKIMSKKGPD
jgi:hypothetical protein